MAALSRSRSAGFIRAAAILVMIGATTTALAACASTPTPAATPSATPSQAPAESAAPSATPTPTATPVALTCSQLITADQIYAYNPNFGTDPGYSPKAGSLAAKAAAYKGLACGWLNQTSGDVIEVAVSRPPAGDLTSLKNAAVTNGQSVPTYGVPPQIDEAYFAMRGSAGEVQVFRGSYWITAVSTAFAEPGDPAPLIQNVLDNLPQG
jgi:hypothetical protein